MKRIGWQDTDTGLCYFDSTKLFPEDQRDQAIAFGRFWRWHINFCPGFKGYFTHQDEETKAALREKYNFPKYQ